MRLNNVFESVQAVFDAIFDFFEHYPREKQWFRCFRRLRQQLRFGAWVTWVQSADSWIYVGQNSAALSWAFILRTSRR